MKKILILLTVLVLSACSSLSQEENNSDTENNKDNQNQTSNTTTDSDCPLLDDKKYPDWNCYEVTDGYTVLHPKDWLTSGQGDTGVFMIGSITANVFYNSPEHMTPEDKELFQKGDVGLFIEERYKNLCGQTDACPKLIDKTASSMAGQEVTLYHYQTAGLAADNATGHLDEYIMGLFEDNYYYLQLLIPSTVSQEEADKRLQEFSEVAKTVSIE